MRHFILLATFVFSQLLVTSQAIEAQDSVQTRARTTLQNMGIPFNDEAFLRYVQSGDAGVVDLFLEAGINVNSKNPKGETALVLASREGHSALVQSLLKAGADPVPLVAAFKAQKADGKDFLQSLSQLSGVFLTILGLLFAHLYNQRTKKLHELETIEKMLPHLGDDKQQQQAASLVALAHLATPELAARFVTVYPGRGSALACLELLRSNTLKDKQILVQALPQLLISAARDGEEETIELLFSFSQKVLPINKPDGEGRTALMWAARNGHANIVKLLLDSDAEFTIADKSGETALHLAAKHAKLETVRLLVDYAKNISTPEKLAEFVNHKDNKRRTALDRAKEKNISDVCCLLENVSPVNKTVQQSADSGA